MERRLYVRVNGEYNSVFILIDIDPMHPVCKIFRREHFFRGADNDDQLLKIMRTLGSDRFDVYLRKYNIPYETEEEALLAKLAQTFWG